MPFGRLVSPSLTDLFVEELERMILSGELKVGERLPTEQELSEKMAVSRAVVYNGVKRLERLGFLRVVPRKGVFVADYLQDGNLETLQAIITYSGEYFSPDTLKPIFTFRRATEGEMVRQAAQKCGKEHAEAVEALLQDLERTEDGDRRVTLMYEFFHQLGICTGNLIYPLLVSTFRPMYSSLLGILLQISDFETCLGYLRKIFQQVAAHDPEASYACAIRLIDFTEEMLSKRYAPGERYRAPTL